MPPPPSSQKYALAASKGFSYALPLALQPLLIRIHKLLPAPARAIYNELYRDVMCAKACAAESAAAMAAFVARFPRVRALHDEFARGMNGEIGGHVHEGFEWVGFPVVGGGGEGREEGEGEGGREKRGRSVDVDVDEEEREQEKEDEEESVPKKRKTRTKTTTNTKTKTKKHPGKANLTRGSAAPPTTTPPPSSPTVFPSPPAHPPRSPEKPVLQPPPASPSPPPSPPHGPPPQLFDTPSPAPPVPWSSSHVREEEAGDVSAKAVLSPNAPPADRGTALAGGGFGSLIVAEEVVLADDPFPADELFSLMGGFLSPPPLSPVVGVDVEMPVVGFELGDTSWEAGMAAIEAWDWTGKGEGKESQDGEE